MKDLKHRDSVVRKLLDRFPVLCKPTLKGLNPGFVQEILELAYDAGYKKACKDWKNEMVTNYWYPSD